MPESGDLIGRVRLTVRLGAGGMGEVWEGVDERLGRRVAVKAIHHGRHSSAVARARFAREARILSRLEHQNVCRLYEFVEGDETDVLIMELVAGRTLREAIKGGLRPAQKLEIAIGICSALTAAHSLSIVHRDLKPENVMVADDGTAKVLDFGVARRLADDDVLPPGSLPYRGDQAAALVPDRLTSAGDVVGTPQYMSPEQARGEAATAASDMFALGLVLFEVFTGSPPYPSGSVHEVLQRASWGDVPVVRGADRHVAALVRDLVALEPQRRPTAGTALERLRRMRERPLRRLRVAAVVVAAAGLVGGTALSLFGLARANREAALARATTDFVIGLFAASDPERTPQGSITARELLDRGVERLRSDLAEQPGTRARLLATLGGIYGNLSLAERSSQLLQEALVLQERAAGPDSATLVPTLLLLANACIGLGDLDRAEEVGRRALRIAADSGDRRHQAKALDNLAAILQRKSRLDEAEVLYRRALAAWQTEVGPDHDETARTMAHLALLEIDRGRPTEAEPLLTRALAVLERRFGREHPDVARVVLNLASAHKDLGRFAEAETLYRRSLTFFEARFGHDNPQCAIAHNDLGVVLFELHRYPEAEAEYRVAVDIAKKVLGSSHPTTGIFESYLAETLHLQGRSADAEALYRTALDVERRAFGERHLAVAESLRGLGVAVAALGRPAEAEAALRQSLDIRRETLGPDHPEVGRTYLDLARVYLANHRRQDAAEALTTARGVLQASYPASHPVLAALQELEAACAAPSPSPPPSPS